MSEDDIYLIPVRLNECASSLKLSDIHYIDIFPDNEYQNGLKKILQVVSPGTFIIRKEQKELSSADVNEMLKEHGFYDQDRNPEGRGVNHQYQVQTIRGDKVVFDEATGLMWQQSGSDNYMEFEAEKKWIKELKQSGYAGFRDWRLRTLEEAMSLVEPEQKEGDLYINPVFDKKQPWIWTSDLVQGGSRAAWVVNFFYGSCSWGYV